MKGSTISSGKTWTAYWSTIDPATGKRVQHWKGGFRTERGKTAPAPTSTRSLKKWTRAPGGLTPDDSRGTACRLAGRQAVGRFAGKRRPPCTRR